jgi:hypothetical protein
VLPTVSSVTRGDGRGWCCLAGKPKNQCRYDYLADSKPIIEQRLSKWVRRGSDPREVSTSYARFLPILAEYDKRGTDPLGSTVSVLQKLFPEPVDAIVKICAPGDESGRRSAEKGRGRRKSCERIEDGADDHLKQTQTRESVRCFCQGGAQSRREAHRLAEQQ